MDESWFPCARCGLMSPELDRPQDPPGRRGVCRCRMETTTWELGMAELAERHLSSVRRARARDAWKRGMAEKQTRVDAALKVLGIDAA